MRKISGGEFEMGSNLGIESETPKHKVYIRDFYLDENLVTNQQFEKFILQTNYVTTAELKGSALGYVKGKFQEIKDLNWSTFNTVERKKHPVVLVSWQDAKAYCVWTKKRLPFECEWEYVAKSGDKEYYYPWGNEEPNGSQSNFSKAPSHIPPTTEINRFKPNSLGIYDLVGNVWQWCEDWFDNEEYASRVNTVPQNPGGPKNGQYKVRRGGSWNVIQSFRLRSSNRGAFDPENYSVNIGFRCAKDY